MSNERNIHIINDKSEGASCDGGGGSLGHPLVYLPLEGRTWVDCYYCSQRFATPGYTSKNSHG